MSPLSVASMVVAADVNDIAIRSVPVTKSAMVSLAEPRLAVAAAITNVSAPAPPVSASAPTPPVIESAPSPPEEDRLWHVGDLDSEDAPHVPISLTYEPRLTTFGDLADVADFLAESPDYRRLGDRISSRFADISEEDPA